MKQIWLVVNAFWHSKSTLGIEKVFRETAKSCGLGLEVKKNNQFLHPNSMENAPKAALFFDKDIRLAQRMEAKGMKLFNSANTIAVCDDKTWTALILEKCGVPQPETILCPLTFPGCGYGDMRFLHHAAEQLGFPLVVKEGKGSFGQQVYLAQNLSHLQQIVSQIGAEPILFQRFIRESAGRDLRVYVVGGQAIAAIRRQNNQGDFRANIENGGVAFPHSPTMEERKLAVAACRAVGADFAGVDLLDSREGPLVCEINSNAHFLGLWRATGINPAEHILAHMKEHA